MEIVGMVEKRELSLISFDEEKKCSKNPYCAIESTQECF